MSPRVMQINILKDENSFQIIPQSDEDQQKCWSLINSCELNGWGKESGGKILHVEIPLFPIGTIRHAKPIDGLPPSGGNDIRM